MLARSVANITPQRCAPPCVDSTRRNHARPTQASSVVRRRPARAKAPDPAGLMAHLAGAIALIRVSERSLSQLQVALGDARLSRPRRAAFDAMHATIDFASISALCRHRQHQTPLYPVSRPVAAPSGRTMRLAGDPVSDRQPDRMIALSPPAGIAPAPSALEDNPSAIRKRITPGAAPCSTLCARDRLGIRPCADTAGRGTAHQAVSRSLDKLKKRFITSGAVIGLIPAGFVIGGISRGPHRHCSRRTLAPGRRRFLLALVWHEAQRGRDRHRADNVPRP